MKLREGPAFGALIIGMGLAFLMNGKGLSALAGARGWADCWLG